MKSSHSKVKNISYRNLEMAPYLKYSRIPIDKKQLIFALRTSMTSVKANFGTMFGDTSCNLCGGGVPQTQQHLMLCPAIRQKCAELRNTSVIYSDLFSNTQKQYKCAILFSKIFDIKEELEEAEKIN